MKYSIPDKRELTKFEIEFLTYLFGKEKSEWTNLIGNLKVIARCGCGKFGRDRGKESGHGDAAEFPWLRHAARDSGIVDGGARGALDPECAAIFRPPALDQSSFGLFGAHAFAGSDCFGWLPPLGRSRCAWWCVSGGFCDGRGDDSGFVGGCSLVAPNL